MAQEAGYCGYVCTIGSQETGVAVSVAMHV